MIVSLFAAAAVLLVLFLISQSCRRTRCSTCRCSASPRSAAPRSVAFAVSASMFAMFLYLTLYLQTILGLSPLQTGLRFLPVTVVSFFVAALSGNLSTRVPVRFLLGVRPAARRHRAAADARPERRPRTGPRCCRASSSPAPASGWSTRRSPRPRSGSCRRSAAGWPRASTTPSARSGSRPASPSSARSSRARSPASSTPKLAGTAASPASAQIAHAVAGRRRRSRCSQRAGGPARRRPRSRSTAPSPAR